MQVLVISSQTPFVGQGAETGWDFIIPFHPLLQSPDITREAANHKHLCIAADAV